MQRHRGGCRARLCGLEASRWKESTEGGALSARCPAGTRLCQGWARGKAAGLPSFSDVAVERRKARGLAASEGFLGEAGGTGSERYSELGRAKEEGSQEGNSVCKGTSP